MYVIVIKIMLNRPSFMQAPVQKSSQTSVTKNFKAHHRLNIFFAPKFFTHQNRLYSSKLWVDGSEDNVTLCPIYPVKN